MCHLTLSHFHSKEKPFSLIWSSEHSHITERITLSGICYRVHKEVIARKLNMPNASVFIRLAIIAALHWQFFLEIPPVYHQMKSLIMSQRWQQSFEITFFVFFNKTTRIIRPFLRKTVAAGSRNMSRHSVGLCQSCLMTFPFQGITHINRKEYLISLTFYKCEYGCTALVRSCFVLIGDREPPHPPTAATTTISRRVICRTP